MPYLGKSLAGSSSIRRFNVTSSTSATHTLTWAPPTEQSIIVSINGVKQHEDAYSISGTTLTLTNALVATDKMEVIGINDVGTTVTAAQGSVNTDKLADDAVTTAKIANDQVTTAKIADDQITTAKIADDQITSAKLANAINITSGNSLTIDSGATITNNGTASGFGKVLQVVSTNSNSTETFVSASGWVDTNLTVNITPASSSNKVLVLVNSHWGGDNKVMAKIVRDSTDISVGAAAGSRTLCSGYDQATTVNNMFGLHFSYLDSPATTSQITYKVQGIAFTNGYLNRSDGDGDFDSRGRTASSITVMEIAG